MKPDKEILIKKWLNDELSPEEFEMFKKLDKYEEYIKISDRAKHFKAPHYNQKVEFEKLNFATSSQKKSSNLKVFKYVAAVAAIAIIAFTLFQTLNTTTNLQSFATSTAKTKSVQLPDQSKVSLNANSNLTYNKDEWYKERQLQLNGEALFKVKKGQKFVVNTAYANVEVLGTVFNVKSRDYIFEVSCFEGSVKVYLKGQSYVLKPKDNLVIDHENILITQFSSAQPDWKTNKTIIDSKSLDIVLKEFQNYYDVNFDASNIDTSTIYSGSFSHNDLKIALNSITLPLGYTYTKQGNTIILSNQ
ncbi:FecR family protein [Mesohalobacter halotolerans]|uniref:DUF4974 domain-containing protein n=1 Tax=Mesohalobacter halotolerans TaxID=1883405 RepID=A0A4U5TTN4_9FLAO|nr:FecR family protein [Mesohalobacter halotolerans]MBS3738501.1 FecR family protein [Psychroflexus sp.]TKS57586.1 DUF4974 domain-containing protein [Mesohalobacter halotolerans]